MEEKKEKSNAKQAAGYSKEQILKSARYEAHRDILEVMLEEGKNYSHEQIRDAVSKFKERKVM
jgi:uncharacterized protein YjbJ (UPF0337 family)